jgi:predicted Rossmann-fold nucleotide-binding protein
MVDNFRIISGGQTGADRAALDAASQLGIACGGYCPKGRKSEDGVIPDKYPLTETKTDNYPERTELNVKTSDGTLILVKGSADRGTNLTIQLCRQYHKPFMTIDVFGEGPATDVNKWLQENHINTLNVAGNRESISPGIHKRAYEFLLRVFKD